MYLHTHFEINRLLVHSDELNALPALLLVSSNVLETVVQTSRYQDKTNYGRRDLPSIVSGPCSFCKVFEV